MTEIRINNARLSFPKLIKPEAFKGKDGAESKPRYSAALLIPKTDTATVAAIRQALLTTAIEKWGPDDGPAEIKRLVAGNKVCLIDGDAAEYDGYEGHWALRTSSTPEYPPTLVDEYAKEVPRDSAGAAAKFYAGCYVNAIVRLWAQGAESGFGKRLNANLGGVQFVNDGEAFGGGGATKASDFTPTVTPKDAFAAPVEEVKGADDIW